jgi:hypothetical protein
MPLVPSPIPPKKGSAFNPSTAHHDKAIKDVLLKRSRLTALKPQKKKKRKRY